jgi:hypothetical protein
MPMGGSSCAEVSTVLAETVLRFQCVERQEKEREDELHAFQSGEERVGGASKGLGLEQLWFLFQDRNEFVRPESGVEAENENLKTIQEQRQNTNLFCTNHRKDSAPTRVSIVPGLNTGAARKGSPPAQGKRKPRRCRIAQSEKPGPYRSVRRESGGRDGQSNAHLDFDFHKWEHPSRKMVASSFSRGESLSRYLQIRPQQYCKAPRDCSGFCADDS